MNSTQLKKLFLSFLLLLVVSCSSSKPREIPDSPYVSAGIEQYFLPELPAWANYSSGGKCYKSSSFQYLNMAKLHEKYQLSYAEIMELQGQYNQRREDYFRSTAHRFLKPVEEASLFSNSMEQVKGGVRQFKLPQVPAVDVIWLEGYIQDGKLAEFKALAKNGKFDERLPVLFSSCLSHQRLNQWVSENGLEQVGFYILGAEWLNPYGSDNALKAGLHIEIGKLLGPGVKVNVVAPPSAQKPTEITL